VSILPIATRQLRQRVLYADRQRRAPRRRGKLQRLPRRIQTLGRARGTPYAEKLGRQRAAASMSLAARAGSPSVPTAGTRRRRPPA
jgi:hypothetical protein